MPSTNANLHAAIISKDDEHYTIYEDIEKEVSNYKDSFKEKIVYCNCDAYTESNFWNFFYNNFKEYKLKKLICTYYKAEERSVYHETEDGENIIEYQLEGNGSYSSEECIKILDEADIVVTNPPFSLFKDYLPTLLEHNKKVLIIGPLSANSLSRIIPYIKNNLIWHGINSVKNFIRPDGTIKNFGNIHWFTNIENNRRTKLLELTSKYSKDKYPRYDNYDAIEVSKVKDIPYDYNDIMGVPISFLDKHCPDQFEIIDILSPRLNGKTLFKRVMIRRR